MIVSDTKAHMECDHEGCVSQLSVELALNTTGTWLVKMPKGHGWQIAYNEGGCFITRCPQHVTRIAPIAQMGVDMVRNLNGKKLS